MYNYTFLEKRVMQLDIMGRNQLKVSWWLQILFVKLIFGMMIPNDYLVGGLDHFLFFHFIWDNPSH